MAELKRCSFLIDRQAALEEIASLQITINGLREGKTILQEALTAYRKAVLAEIQAAPAVDAVKVVRCKDCIGWTTWLKTKEPSVSMCGLSGLYVGNHRDDLFCPYGERREEDG